VMGECRHPQEDEASSHSQKRKLLHCDAPFARKILDRSCMPCND
jgi:hypothetical protein